MGEHRVAGGQRGMPTQVDFDVGGEPAQVIPSSAAVDEKRGLRQVVLGRDGGHHPIVWPRVENRDRSGVSAERPVGKRVDLQHPEFHVAPSDRYASLMRFPTRVVNLDNARAHHGDLVDRLVPWLYVQDPLADDVVSELAGDYLPFHDALRARTPQGAPASVRALLEAHARIPLWVDQARAARGGRLFFRTGLVGAIVLGARSLVAGYCSPAGNKPLALTGTLEHGGAKRLAETGKYVSAVSAEDGLVPGGDGWQITLRVRLMHAHVRHLVHTSGQWRPDQWGAPINQHDLLATSLLFSSVFIDGVRVLGLQVDRDEAEDHLHLWRWASWLMGVNIELLPDSEAHAQRISQVIELTQGPPDDDARRLVDQLLQPPPGQPARPFGRDLAQGLCYALLPRRQAEGLGLPRTPWRYAATLSRLAVAPAEFARRYSPRFEDEMVRYGERHWQRAVSRGLSGGKPTFTPPSALRGKLT